MSTAADGLEALARLAAVRPELEDRPLEVVAEFVDSVGDRSQPVVVVGHDRQHRRVGFHVARRDALLG